MLHFIGTGFHRKSFAPCDGSECRWGGWTRHGDVPAALGRQLHPALACQRCEGMICCRSIGRPETKRFDTNPLMFRLCRPLSF